MKRRALTGQLDQLHAERNEAAKAGARLMKEKSGLPVAVREQRKKLGERVAGLEAELRRVEAELDQQALYVPNLPLPDLPDGDASHNAVLRSWGTPRPREPGLKPHWELGTALGILDFERGAKIAGSGFPLFVGMGSKLVRALINFMLDLHTREHGYVELEPPFVVKREMMQGTGQVPKFEADAYRTEPDDLFLVPTAEVPVTNLHRDEIVDGARLPLAYTAYTPCFRREAGAAGKDTRGLLRVHQFDKVELVRFARPADSPTEHEKMTAHAEAVLQRLELPYRVVLLAAGDVGFASAKTYDLEAWAPAVGQWLEVSSSSTFTDFQARRGTCATTRVRRAGSSAGSSRGSTTRTPTPRRRRCSIWPARSARSASPSWSPTPRGGSRRSTTRPPASPPIRRGWARGSPGSTGRTCRSCSRASARSTTAPCRWRSGSSASPRSRARCSSVSSCSRCGRTARRSPRPAIGSGPRWRASRRTSSARR